MQSDAVQSETQISYTVVCSVGKVGMPLPGQPSTKPSDVATPHSKRQMKITQRSLHAEHTYPLRLDLQIQWMGTGKGSTGPLQLICVHLNTWTETLHLQLHVWGSIWMVSFSLWPLIVAYSLDSMSPGPPASWSSDPILWFVTQHLKGHFMTWILMGSYIFLLRTKRLHATACCQFMWVAIQIFK